MKISIPIIMSIAPPKISALFESFEPNFLPTATPAKQSTNVTAAIIREHISAYKKLYDAIVKPT